jgi:hypothetical protein
MVPTQRLIIALQSERRETSMAFTSFEMRPGSQYRIDCFDVPTTARSEFEAAMHRNFAFIKTLPGFLWHFVFEKSSGPSRFNVVTIAAWESADAINNAVSAVRQYYQKIGFDPVAATAKWGVAGEIGQYESRDEGLAQGHAINRSSSSSAV